MALFVLDVKLGDLLLGREVFLSPLFLASFHSGKPSSSLLVYSELTQLYPSVVRMGALGGGDVLVWFH